MTSQPVRVRIAPSPTGDPHVGTAYTTLFNYVFAKKAAGTLVFRLEDTDQKRSQASSERQLFDYLKWLGLDWQEGPDVGGDYGPYRQSERLAIYQEHIDKLLAEGKVYRCFCTPEELAEMRQNQKGGQTGYDRRYRDVPQDVIDEKLKSGQPYVIRMKVPLEGSTTYRDELRGDITFDNSQIDDQVLMKADGFPTYHFANVVDDHLMKISHVIRGEDWLSSTPKHVLLYAQLGWEPPKFYHLPLLRNVDKSKLSKRKNPVSLAFYREAGILPEALVNFMGLMGWRPSDEEEIFGLDKMVEEFEFKDMSLGGPVFDQVKLNWVNQEYLKQMSEERFVGYLRDELFTVARLKQIMPLALERLSRFDEFIDRNRFFFGGELNYEGLAIVPAKMEKPAFVKGIKVLLEKLDGLFDWRADAIKACLDEAKGELGWKPKDFFLPVRMIATGRKDSPPLVESLEVIGREMVRYRMRQYLEFAKKN